MKQSITEYRAFALPHLPDDPEDGFVRFAVGEGIRPVRFREEIDDYLRSLAARTGAPKPLVEPLQRGDPWQLRLWHEANGQGAHHLGGTAR